MKFAILGDIHGNKFALKSVLDSIKKNHINKLLITGDLVGYYPFVKETIELLAPWEKIVVSGNHELMLKKCLENKNYLETITLKYGSSIKRAIKELNPKDLEFLTTLKHPIKLEIENKKIIICHGSPKKIDEYIYPDAEIGKITWLEELDADIIILGHTHYPMIKKYKNKIIINPGSVGQPRNINKNAQWVIYDTNKDLFKFMSEPYEVKKLVETVKKTDPNIPYLYKVLETNA